MKIFLVEDSAMVRARLVDMLDAIPGASVVGEAARAASAVREILERRPDVVLLDLNLGEGNGFDVLRALQARAPEIDIYMLSNFAALPYRQLAERLGARGYFDKSKDLARVREMIAARAAVKH